MILWYILTSLLGLLAFPLVYRLLPGLPSRGYAFARALGLLLWGYGFWLLGSLNLLGNNLGGLLFTLILLAALGIFAFRGVDRLGLREWARVHRSHIIVVETLFLLAYGFMALLRAANPDMFGTEKPMEIAFISAILRSPTMPPHDPWLSGYGISYYYFGYVLTAMLAKMTSVASPVAHNLATSLVFAMSAIGAYALVYDLVRLWRVKRGQAGKTDPDADLKPKTPVTGRFLYLPLLGPLFLLIVSNLEGFLELLHARHIFWDGSESRFWSWLDIQDLNVPPVGAPAWEPRNFGTGSWWWWRASRVVRDYLLDGETPHEIIGEFPFFSYLLADLHPHVLAMPYLLLAAALALNLFAGGARGSFVLGRLKIPLNLPSFLFAVVVLGSLGFLNTWDFPVAVALFAGAYAISVRSSFGEKIKDFLKLSLTLGISGILLYLPFYLGFSSQAGGFLPSLIYVTRGAHLWVQFGQLLLPMFALLLFLYTRKGSWRSLGRGLAAAAVITALLWLVMLLLTLLIAILPSLSALNPQAAVAPDIFLGSLGAENWGELLRESVSRRLESPGGWLTLFLLIGLVVGLLFEKEGVRDKGPGIDDRGSGRSNAGEMDEEAGAVFGSHRFVLLLILFGGLLVYALEFVYLRDHFGYRLNSVFKFYYQAWILWSIAAAYGLIVLLAELHRRWAVVFGATAAVLTAMALVYPVYGTVERLGFVDGWEDLTLNGAAYLEEIAPDELAAIRWLREAPPGVIAEAVAPGGGAYTDYARVSEFSGQPAVIGWVNHEAQWRGGYEEIGSRQQDIERLYTTRSWDEASEILDAYDIRYVVVGNRERATYPRLNEAKFERFLKLAFAEGGVRVYEAPVLISTTAQVNK